MAIAALPDRGLERILDLAIRTGPFGDRFVAVQGGLSLDIFSDKPDGVLIGPALPRAAEGFATESGKIEIAPPLILSVRKSKSLKSRHQCATCTPSYA